ncbi:MAG: hypothetical protein ABSA52_16970 [Candidatus Binatia bacterium]
MSARSKRRSRKKDASGIADPWDLRPREKRIHDREYLKAWQNRRQLDELLATLRQRWEAGRGQLFLNSSELEAVLDAVAKAAEYSEILPGLREHGARLQQALDEWNARKINVNVRARNFVNCLLGLPSHRGRRSDFDAVRVVQAYKFFTSGVIKRPPWDHGIGIYSLTWEECGLPRPSDVPNTITKQEGRTWMVCDESGKRLSPPDFHTKKQALGYERDIQVIHLPLCKRDAITAVKHVFKFSSEYACVKFLERQKVRGLPAVRDR